jgi:hypothetical protein
VKINNSHAHLGITIRRGKNQDKTGVSVVDLERMV